MTARSKILIVDDRPENLFALEQLLKELDVEVHQALSGFGALNLTLEHDFCVAIVDIQMPEIDGYELVELLRSNEGTATLPIIFISAIFSDEYHHRKGYEAGAVDFMSKPFVPEILLSKVKVFINLYRQRQTLEEEVKQRRQAEAALHEANLALSKINADKDKLFSIISHDLRSPFNVLLGNAQLLVERIDKLSQHDIQDMTQGIYNGSKAVYNLLENLLMWAQLQREGGIKYSPEPIELRALADETLAVLVQTAAHKEIELSNSIPPDFWVKADRYMLETVIRNLAGNALKFTPRGGQVTLRGYENGINDQSDFVKVSVQDTGVGMNRADAAKLFRIDTCRSTLGTEREKGSGLGLIICKEMVEQNGGKIWVESKLGKGTKVEFTVPCATDI
ncbi:MAG: hybrid sensor histidine kinase/response regulator [Chloroflexi bacterium]|nr:hybrid sensor histidine kinase/response regulator [Chloroflexota bacterium]